MKNIDDADRLRNHILSAFEKAAQAENPAERAALMTFVIVGGGATGVELAGTLGELRSDVLRATFPDVDPERFHIRLVEMAPDLLMPFNPKLRAYTRRQLEKRGIDIRVNTTIKEVTPNQVLLADGTWLRSDLTVWTGGVAAADSVGSWGLPQGKSGRLLVGSDLRVQGTDRIFATGDISLDQENPSPQLAQPALQEGRHAAEQIIHLVRGEPTQPFHYHDKGTMATIGRRSAVVELARGARITGTLAWFAWLGLHLFYLIGNRNRIATIINLAWRYIAWGHGGGVIVGDEPTEPVRKDDVTGAAKSAAEAPGENAEKEPAETRSRETQPSERGVERAAQTSGERAR
jgi:NADH dehydrogenase